MTDKRLKTNYKVPVNSPVKVLCETYNIKEQYSTDEKGNTIQDKDGNPVIEAVWMEGVAITFNKPTRNRVSYTYDSGLEKHKSLIGKPILDSHNDTSIRTHPPFGHVENCWPGTNPKNNLPCLFYRANIDPDEREFIRKAKRKDIPGVSIQVLVDDVVEKEDMYGEFIEANIREYLELSGVLIPGDGDTSIALAERFRERKKKEGTITPDGVYSQKKVNESEDENEEKPLMPLPDSEEDQKTQAEQKIYQPDPYVDEESPGEPDIPKNKRMKNMEDKKNMDYSDEEDKMDKIDSKLEKLISLLSKKEGLEEGQPEDDKKGKETGKEKPVENPFEEAAKEIAKAVKEELKGHPERDTGYEDKDLGSKQNPPMTQQPSNGESPNSKGFEQDHNYDEEGDGDDATKKVKKPSSDYDKMPTKKNKMEEAKRLVERAKKLMREYNGEDPTEPNPGETTKDKKKMDDQEEPKDKTSGFNERIKSKRKSKREQNDREDYDEEQGEVPGEQDTGPDEYEESVKRMYKSLKKEISKENGSRRKSIVGTTGMTTKESQARQQEYLNNKQDASSTIREYLRKTGNNQAMRYM